MNEPTFTPPSADEIEMAKLRRAFLRALVIGHQAVEADMVEEAEANANIVRAIIQCMEMNLAVNGLIKGLGASGGNAMVFRIQSLLTGVAVLVSDTGVPRAESMRDLHDSLDILIEGCADAWAEKRQMQAAAKDGEKKSPPPEWR